MKEKPKECPFCKSDGEVHFCDKANINTVLYQHRCSNDVCEVRPMTDWQLTAGESLNIWNYRG